MVVRFSIDDLVRPWDLELTVNGQTWRTRPLAVGDVVKISALADAVGDGMRMLAAVQEVLAGLFVSPGPDLATWSPAQIATAAAAIMTYFKGRSGAGGNSLGIADVAAAMSKSLAAAEPSASSSAS